MPLLEISRDKLWEIAETEIHAQFPKIDTDSVREVFYDFWQTQNLSDKISGKTEKAFFMRFTNSVCKAVENTLEPPEQKSLREIFNKIRGCVRMIIARDSEIAQNHKQNLLQKLAELPEFQTWNIQFLDSGCRKWIRDQIGTHFITVEEISLFLGDDSVILQRNPFERKKYRNWTPEIARKRLSEFHDYLVENHINSWTETTLSRFDESLSKYLQGEHDRNNFHGPGLSEIILDRILKNSDPELLKFLLSRFRGQTFASVKRETNDAFLRVCVENPNKPIDSNTVFSNFTIRERLRHFKLKNGVFDHFFLLLFCVGDEVFKTLKWKQLPQNFPEFNYLDQLSFPPKKNRNFIVQELLPVRKDLKERLEKLPPEELQKIEKFVNRHNNFQEIFLLLYRLRSKIRGDKYDFSEIYNMVDLEIKESESRDIASAPIKDAVLYLYREVFEKSEIFCGSGTREFDIFSNFQFSRNDKTNQFFMKTNHRILTRELRKPKNKPFLDQLEASGVFVLYE